MEVMEFTEIAGMLALLFIMLGVAIVVASFLEYLGYATRQFTLVGLVAVAVIIVFTAAVIVTAWVLSGSVPVPQ